MKIRRLPFDSPPEPRPMTHAIGPRRQSTPQPRPAEVPPPALRHPARRTDPDTSHEAAHAARTSVTQGTLMAAVFRSIERQGRASGHMVAADLGESYQAASRRISDLRDLGLIRDSGERMVGPFGRNVIAWEVKPDV